MRKKETDRDCIVCSGKIVSVVDHEFDATTGPMIIGPGSRGQFREVRSYHCGNCGIKYEFLPPANVRRVVNQ